MKLWKAALWGILMATPAAAADSGAGGDGVDWMQLLTTLLGGALAVAGGWAASIGLEHRRENRLRRELLVGLDAEITAITATAGAIAGVDDLDLRHQMLSDLDQNCARYNATTTLLSKLDKDLVREIDTFYWKVRNLANLAKRNPFNTASTLEPTRAASEREFPHAGHIQTLAEEGQRLLNKIRTLDRFRS